MTREFKQLLDDLATVQLTQHHQQMDSAIQDARHLVEHGEEGVALENICQNLYEWDFPLSRAHYESLQEIGQHYGLESRTWSYLEKIVV